MTHFMYKMQIFNNSNWAPVHGNILILRSLNISRSFSQSIQAKSFIVHQTKGRQFLSCCLGDFSWYGEVHAAMGSFADLGECIISHQEVLRSVLKKVNNQAGEAVLFNHCINGQLLRTSVLTGWLCFGALWNFCLSLNCDSWADEGKLFFWNSLVLSSLLSIILNPFFDS